MIGNLTCAVLSVSGGLVLAAVIVKYGLPVKELIPSFFAAAGLVVWIFGAVFALSAKFH